MAYALRYYKELTHADGTVIRLEIYKKDSTASAVEIGAVVQRLSLEIQGQQDDIDSPIQKTSLHMTFVDASDIENGQKNGFWQEFYTPDALMWKVILKAKDAKETSFRTIWGGYVTPDSFSEDLVYRGSVSITARDNIGHMQDFPFDAEGDADGMISLYNLVESGWEKIHSPMMLEWRGAAESTMWLMCDGVSAMFTLMNVSMFEGMDWYKAIETALASYGVVMRYIGNNIVKISSLRSMPYQGAENIEDLIHIEPTFVSGATRELIPAVKRIEESVGYDIGEEYQPRIDTQDFSGNTFDVETSWGTVENIAWSLLQSAPMSDFGWYNETPFKTLAFNPNAYEVDDMLSDSDKEDLHKYTCVLTGSKDDNTHSLSYAMSVNAEDFAINVTFGKFLSRLTHGYGDYFLGYPANEPPAEFRVRFAVKVQANGVTSYLTEWGGWSTEFASQKVDVSGDKMSVNIPLSGKYTGKVLLSFVFLNIDTNEDAVRIKQILALSLSSVSNKPMLENNAVNTKYNENNNVILTRDPEIGPAYNEVALPAFIKNGIFYRQGDVILPARKWSWGSGSEQQMAVWNHLQLLSYYAKPNNLISGTIVNADITRAKAIYMWHGAEHILISGTYNFLNGHIESAMLREFARYEDMWSEVAGAGLPDTEQYSRSNVEGGASSGGATSTYSSTTNVNIGSGGGGGTGASYLNDLLDVDTAGVVAQSVLYYNGTSWVDMSFPTLLNPYLKADVAANTYAKSSDLSALSTRVGANEGSIASLQSGKADKATTLAGYGIKDAYTTTQIDTKVSELNTAIGKKADASSVYTTTQIDAKVQTINNALALRYTKTEVDAIVETINDALADRYTKAQVDGIVTTINNSITSVDNKYASTKTWADTLASLIVNENGNIRIKTNLIVNGDTASGGGSGESAIGITGILLNGTTYRDENGDGIIDLGTITSGLTSVNWTDVQGRPTSLSQFNNDLGLGTLAYKNGLTASEVGALSTAGGTLSGAVTMDGTIARLKMNGGILEFNDASGNFEAYLRVYQSNLSVYDGASWRKIYHTGNFNPADYLPKSGGTLTGALTINTDRDRSLVFDEPTGEKYHIISFAAKGQEYASLVVNYLGDENSLLFNNKKLLHTGNYSSYALPKAGGTINGASGNYTPLIVKTTSLSEVWIAFEDTVGLTHIGSVRGVPSINSGSGNKTIIHSGNIGSYKSGDSDKLGGLSASSYVATKTITGDLNATDLYASRSLILSLNSSAQNVPSGMNSGEGIYIAGYDTGFMLLSSYTQDKLMYRRGTNSLGSNTILSNAWKQVAFTDSNVASATKLATARTIWGQSFDGTGNVDGYLHMNGLDVLHLDESNLWLNYGAADAGKSLRLCGNDVAIYYGKSSNFARAMTINSSGNVTIGSRDLAGTNYTLRTVGPMASPLYYFVDSQHEQHGYIGLASSGNNDIYLNSVSSRIRLNSDQGIILNDSNGNVLIGTTTDSGYKLDVGGTMRLGNDLTIFRPFSSKEYIKLEVRDIEVRYKGYDTDGFISHNFYSNDTRIFTIHGRDKYISTPYAAVVGTNLTVNNNATVNGALSVGGASTFNGDVRINGNLIVTGDISA